MTSRGLILRPWQMQAALADRLALVCRVINPQPQLSKDRYRWDWKDKTIGRDRPIIWMLHDQSPFGVPGQEFWIKETWARYHTVDYIRRPDGRAFSEVSDGLACYRADGHDSIVDAEEHIKLMSDYGLEEVIFEFPHWRSSTQMPRWASRFTYTLLNVRVMRVQDVTVDDALNCGVICTTDGPWCAREEYMDQFDKDNPKHPRTTNPWCWFPEIERKMT